MAEREDHELTHDELVLKKITRLEVGLFGVEGTDSRGLAGEIRDFRLTVTTITKEIAVIQAKCEERHGTGRENSSAALKEVSSGRKWGFVGSLIITIGAAVYTLGAWLGWWPPAPPGD